MADSRIHFTVALNKDGKPRRGEALRWLDEVALKWEGDECLPFPFYRAASGHGRLSGRSGPALAHVYVLNNTQGAKPSPKHEGCHRCGNGNLGCVNPRHLYWGTRSENMRDRKLHGVAVNPPRMIGSQNPITKLSEDEVRQIKAALSAGVTGLQLAKKYNVSSSAVHNIKLGKAWAWLT